MTQETAYKTDLYNTIKNNQDEYFYCHGCDSVWKYDADKDINIFICYYSELAWDFELQSISCGCND